MSMHLDCIHAKVFVHLMMIRQWGSINLDFQSLYLHFENGYLFMIIGGSEGGRDFERGYPSKMSQSDGD